MWLGKKGEKDRAVELWRCLKNLDEYVDKKFGGVVDVLLLGCLGGVVIVWKFNVAYNEMMLIDVGTRYEKKRKSRKVLSSYMRLKCPPGCTRSSHYASESDAMSISDRPLLFDRIRM